MKIVLASQTHWKGHRDLYGSRHPTLRTVACNHMKVLIFCCFHLYLVSASPMQGTRLVLIIGALFYFLSLCACQVTPFSRCSRPFENLDDALFVWFHFQGIRIWGEGPTTCRPISWMQITTNVTNHLFLLLWEVDAAGKNLRLRGQKAAEPGLKPDCWTAKPSLSPLHHRPLAPSPHLNPLSCCHLYLKRDKAT